MAQENYTNEWLRKAYYKEYVNYCMYEDHTKPVSFEEWNQHCDEKGRWVK